MGAVSIPAPVGGWNARDALEAMEPTDAVELVNWVPGNGVVTGRGGSLTKINLGSSVDTLIPYISSTATKLLAAYGGNISDITTFGSPTVLSTGNTSNAWQFAAFDNKVVLVNGADAAKVYDGAAITPMVITLVATPAAPTLTQVTGTLPAANYTYRVSALNASGETLASASTSLTLASSAGIKISWVPVVGATGYKIYGRGGTLKTIATVGNVTSYTDSSSSLPVGDLPTVNTTGPAATDLIGVVNFKGRAFYWEKNKQRFWYAAAGSFQGILTEFPFAMFAQKGGYIVQIITWTRDAGDGVDDYCAFIFSTGETLIYQGDDPSDATRWSMVGRFQLGAPLGIRSHCRFASTEIVLTDDGFVALDEAIQNARTQVIDTWGGKIVRAAKAAAKAYRANFGWSATYYPAGNLFVANIPLAAGQSEQYVRNTNTGAWCRFRGWNARCFAVFNDRLYFGTNDGKVVLADVSSTDGVQKAYSDDGFAIQYEALTAYQRFGQPGLKTQLTAARVVTNAFDPRALSLNAFADYRPKLLPPLIDPIEQIQGTWDVSSWDADYWGGDNNDPANTFARPTRRPIIAFGFAVAMSIRYRSVVQNVSWFSTFFEFKQGGVN